MPITFIDIERRKNWRIALFFLVLMAIYLAVAALIAVPLLGGLLFASPRFLFTAFILTATAASVHFWFSASHAVETVTRGLGALPPDPHDDIHRVLLNVMDELHVVTGNKRQITSAVIPSLSMNALAVADLRGKAMIAITEGLLSRLNRPQLESVIAHEGHHILSGDCLESTVAASLFGTLSSFVERIQTTSQNRAASLSSFPLSWTLLQLSYLLNMFISREREYRADAASVRMTRNPLALAEALHLLSRSWRGAGFIGSGYEMLCIVNPQQSALDESEGFWSDLFSTHPPLAKRIDLLLGMARVSKAYLDMRSSSGAGAIPNGGATAYYAMDPQQVWQGPFALTELAALPWLTPLTWISGAGGAKANRAWKEQAVNAIFLERLAGNARVVSSTSCPSCHQPLLTENYAGTTVLQCSFCAGVLVDMPKIPRLIARTEKHAPCSDRIMSLARKALQENHGKYLYNRRARAASIPPLACPKCGNPMFRRFYSMTQLVEIDQCSFCQLTWFDQYELQMLQCMIQHRLVPETELPACLEEKREHDHG